MQRQKTFTAAGTIGFNRQNTQIGRRLAPILHIRLNYRRFTLL